MLLLLLNVYNAVHKKFDKPTVAEVVDPSASFDEEDQHTAIVMRALQTELAALAKSVGLRLHIISENDVVYAYLAQPRKFGRDKPVVFESLFILPETSEGGKWRLTHFNRREEANDILQLHAAAHRLAPTLEAELKRKLKKRGYLRRPLGDNGLNSRQPTP